MLGKTGGGMPDMNALVAQAINGQNGTVYFNAGTRAQPVWQAMS